MSPHDQAERYRLTGRIATGGMGEVWRAEDTVLDREVAVKILKHEYADDPTFRARFEAEARHAAALVHPNIASVFDFGELVDDDGSGTRPFLVMELVPGQPLSALLRGGEQMPAERAAELVAQAADAIGAAHALGIVHRDVKPANLLVTPDGTVKITDFGIARVADGAAITQTGQIVGTPHYISPEQAEGRPASEASDIYALGVVLFECLAGRRPFDRDTPIQVALAHIREDVPPLHEDVPQRMRAIVEKALAKDPEQRFSSAGELATALRGGDVAGLGAAGAAAASAMTLDAGSTQVLEQVPAQDPDDTLAGAGAVGAGAAGAAAAGAGAAGAGRHSAATTTYDDEEGRRTLPPWWPWAAAAAAVLLLVLVAAAFANDGSQEPAAANPASSDSPSASSTPSKSPSKSPSKKADDRIRVRKADYVGRDHKDAKKELEGLGFHVEEQKVQATSPDQAKDTVADVTPSGLVDPGSTITLQVWEEYKAPKQDAGWDKKPGKDPKGKGKGKGHEH